MKKNNATYLHIASPCEEGWEQMTPEAQGRFCGSCQKTVIDFTQMSDAQVLTTIAKAAGGCCGRFTGHQLERPMQQPVQALHPFIHYSAFFTAAAFAGLLTLALPDTLHAQAKTANTATHVQDTIPALTRDTSAPSREWTLGKVAMVPAIRQIKGVITDQDNNRLAHAFVTLVGTHLRTKTDSNGKYVLNIPVSTKQVVLLVQCIGYPDMTTKFQEGDKGNVYNMTVLNSYIMGKIVSTKVKQ